MTLDNRQRMLDFGRKTMLVAMVSCAACQSTPSEVPSLSDEKIARIMADIGIAEAATNGLSGYTKDSLTQAYYKQVFEIHGISMETYEKDLRIIAKDLPRMEDIVKQADELLTEGSKATGTGLNQ